jgi:excisionase family DNA binding protein
MADLIFSSQSTSVNQNVPFFENQLLSYKEAARYLSLSESYLRRLKSEGNIPFVPVSDRGVRFRVGSLNRWIEKREVTT